MFENDLYFLGQMFSSSWVLGVNLKGGPGPSGGKTISTNLEVH